MAGDYTRSTFKAWQDHLGVLMQQGKVMLDADWNEFVELLERRLQAETLDIFNSHCIVPKETPDGFLIKISGTNITISRGRAYVDGLLAENHGTGDAEFDRVLEEQHGKDPFPYDKQPYLPNAASVAPLPTGGPFLVYLDVWKREVTYLQDPDLMEKAVNVDTATRVQTVWQVKALGDVGDITCSTPDDKIKGWNDKTKASAARLTTDAVGVPSSNDPCILPPNGGYRGTENRLYRVEIHDAGAQGAATFKWSRDNASVASAVRAINTTRDVLTVVRTGRDVTLRFSAGDWVEVTDDWRELWGLPGVMAKVQTVDDVKLTVTLTASLPAATFDANDLTRHTRVIRWDQKGLVRDKNGVVVWDVEANNGVIRVPAGTVDIVLEDGVQVTFSSDPAGGSYHPADYWFFAARTVDASVEKLNQAPPRAIHHHYCKLAVVTMPNKVEDCRDLWPPDVPAGGGCECTVCLSPGDKDPAALQKAVEQVKKLGGGKICLAPGFYFLRQPVLIDGAVSLQIEGRGASSVIIANFPEPAIQIHASADVTLDSFTLVNAGPTIAVTQAIRARLYDLVLLTTGSESKQGSTPCVMLRNSLSVEIAHSLAVQSGAFRSGDHSAVVGLSNVLVETSVHDNLLVGARAIASNVAAAGFGFASAAGTKAASSYLFTLGLYIRNNMAIASEAGIALDGFTVHLGETKLEGNSLNACSMAGIAAVGLNASQFLAGSQIEIDRNTVRTRQKGHGIAIATDDTRVVNNDVAGFRSTPLSEALATDIFGISHGIVLAPSLLEFALAENQKAGTTQAETTFGIERCMVVGNRVTKMGGHGIYVGPYTRIVSALIKQNMIEQVGGGGIIMAAAENIAGASPTNSPYGQLLSATRALHLAVENNQLLNLGAGSNDEKMVVAGILLTNTLQGQVANNIIDGVGVNAPLSRIRAGILMLGARSIRLAGNSVLQVGGAEFMGRAFGIAVSLAFERVEVTDNIVRRLPALKGDVTQGRWQALRIQGAAPTQVGTQKINLPRGRAQVAVRGNVLEALGEMRAVDIQNPGACLFSDNHCSANTGERPNVAQIHAGAIVASSNYLEGPVGEDTVTLLLQFPSVPAPCTVVGNVTSGRIQVNGIDLAPPWQALNVREM